MDPRWYEHFFDEDALDVWQQSRSDELTADEIEYLDAILAAEPGSALLDLACGNGRHAIGLAARGYRMTGVDIAEANRARIAERAAASSVSVDVRIGDMSAIDFGGPYAGAYLWGNSFGYTPPEVTRAWLEATAAALAPGARLVIDTAMVAEIILGDLARRTWAAIDADTQVLMESSYQPRESRIDTTYTTIRRGRVTGAQTAHVWVMTCAELSRTLESAGFEMLDLHGDLDGARFELGCEQLIAIAARAR